MQNTKIDPFTLEIVKDSLTAVGEEMFYTLGRTSMSPIIYEVLDYATGLTDAKGDLLTQGNGVAGFIGMLSFMVKETVKKFQDDLKPGDIIIINDSYNGGGSHLSDVGLVMPIFYEEELVAFSANKAHWTEVGGKDPGSFTNDATEIYQEGLQFPCVKLFEEGKLNQALVDIIQANVRLPELSLSDMWAQIASLRIGERRFLELCRKYGKETVLQTTKHLLDQGEIISRSIIQSLPNGDYYAEDYIDTDGLGNGPFQVQVKVTITDDNFVCDFRGSHPQVPGPINCSYTTLVSDVRTVFLAITNDDQHINDGVFRPLEIITDPGSIFSAERPAPMSVYWESGSMGGDLVWKALAPVIPSKLPAGHFLSVCAVTLSGNHPDTKNPFLIVEPSLGGWGAGNDQDGARGQFCIGDGETYNVPVEIAEARYGVMVDEYSLNADGEGAGEFIGGAGVIRSYQALTDGQFATVTFGRHKYVPWGFNEGKDGSPNQFYVMKKNGVVDGPYGVYARYPLNKGDVLKLVTGSGGGYGHPFARPITKVVEDVKNEYITVHQAKEVYGVVLDEGTYDLMGLSSARKEWEENIEKRI
ncbi:hydantoinase B/oxoprolinase family protein [Shimazuella kribbensis]|uniref:hydantoinase B/oxoprolinase family protein n=1 Tax=Shimazuella kribbensis TaxID=139808 RepID=UPI000417EF19|nr:hydantoinase B/oxoprolinase family protein [Shimazuella kribbensis]